MSNYKENLKHISTLIFDYDGVLTDGTVFMMPDGEALRAGNVKDGYALQLAVKNGYRILVISGGNSTSMVKRLEMLGITDYYLGVKNKIEIFHKILLDHNITAKEVMYMGDDIPDFEIMKEVGVACCPSDATEEIKGIAHFISHFSGGKGAVRDIIEQIMKIQGKWFNGDAFHW
ncbi:MAG: HAD hydrolase family protein [Bacteroidales bacterium]|jgi:3-deoxy-D-manno-octulosonate 8-phosphate phosphatase (KDO 8-P phosphatase)|nr:HAD hydrolase family protein [Bacteroidales bacterium]